MILQVTGKSGSPGSWPHHQAKPIKITSFLDHVARFHRFLPPVLVLPGSLLPYFVNFNGQFKFHDHWRPIEKVHFANSNLTTPLQAAPNAPFSGHNWRRQCQTGSWGSNAGNVYYRLYKVIAPGGVETNKWGYVSSNLLQSWHRKGQQQGMGLMFPEWKHSIISIIHKLNNDMENAKYKCLLRNTSDAWLRKHAILLCFTH